MNDDGAENLAARQSVENSVTRFETGVLCMNERFPVVRRVVAAMLTAVVGLALSSVATTTSLAAEPTHGLSVFGDLKYPPDFEHFDYADPDAIKGGSVTLGRVGSYDNLNPWILKGQAAIGATTLYDTLTARSNNEPGTAYGLLAESIEVADDKRWVIFRLRREARWHDGVALTADDVVWTFDSIMSEGHPRYRTYWQAVATAEAIDPHTVKFSFKEGNNAELPLIIGELPVMPKHFWAEREFATTTLEPLLGSGPYRFGKIDPGRSISYERVDDYWGRNLPVRVGHENFDVLRYDYYRDASVMLEAFKAGDIDFRLENIARNWATAYEFPAVKEGRVVREELPDKALQTMQGFVVNLRQARFQDRRVREALGYAFDFEWMNENLFFGAYERTHSYFQNSEMQASGLPDGRELEILENLREQVPQSVFTEEFSLPSTDGSGNLRANYRQALRLFKEAGFSVRDGKMTNDATGENLDMEFLLGSASFEKIGLAYAKTLERLGITLKVRIVDSAQYEKRSEDFDFDMIIGAWRQSESPGNEQVDYWGSSTANKPGSRNTMGIANPAVDAIIKLIVAADSRDEQVAAARALDRVLLHERYIIPQWFGPTHRVAYWNKFSHPEIMPTTVLGFETWWVDPEKDAAL